MCWLRYYVMRNPIRFKVVHASANLGSIPFFHSESSNLFVSDAGKNNNGKFIWIAPVNSKNLLMAIWVDVHAL